MKQNKITLENHEWNHGIFDFLNDVDTVIAKMFPEMVPENRLHFSRYQSVNSPVYITNVIEL